MNKTVRAEPQQGSITRPSAGSNKRETLGPGSRTNDGSGTKPAPGSNSRDSYGSGTRSSNGSNSNQNAGSNNRNHTDGGSDTKNTSSALPLLAEGTAIKNVAGKFEINGARVFFKTGQYQLCCTENLMLQRIYEMSRNLQSAEQWTVDGTVTTYMDKNYITIQNARRMPRSNYSKLPSQTKR